MVDDVVGLFPDAFQPIVWAVFFFALLGAAGAVFYKKMSAAAPVQPGSPIDMRALGIAIQSDMAQKEMAEAMSKLADNVAQIRAIVEKDIEREIEHRHDVFMRLDKFCDRLETIIQARPRGRA